MSEERKKLAEAYSKVLDIYAKGFDRISQLLRKHQEK